MEEWLTSATEAEPARDLTRGALSQVLGDTSEDRHVRGMVEEMVVRAVAQTLNGGRPS
jgi:hypothetical protein